MQPIHILSQMGVMSSFSIAKKVTEEDIKKYFSIQKKRGKSDKEIGNMLRKHIMEEIQEAIEHNILPGLVNNEDAANELGIDKRAITNMPELIHLITAISQSLLEKKYDKLTLCYFINGMVNILGLQEKDFRKFHLGDDFESGNEDDDSDK